MYIYCITNNLNGMKYVGMTSKSIQESRSYYGSGRYVTRALKKLGKDKFTKEIIEVCDNLENLKERERYWINKLNTKHPNGYNLTDGGDGVVGLTEESRNKISTKLKKYKGENHPLYGTKRSLETRKKISELHKGKKKTKEHIRKILETKAKNGYNLTEEGREKIRKTHLGKKISQESILKTIENNPKRKPVLQFTLDNEFISEYFSIKDASRKTGVKASSICRCCKGILSQSKGYVWRYKEKAE